VGRPDFAFRPLGVAYLSFFLRNRKQVREERGVLVGCFSPTAVGVTFRHGSGDLWAFLPTSLLVGNSVPIGLRGESRTEQSAFEIAEIQTRRLFYCASRAD
jgi:hypothetical protein